jgi:MFS family permease
VARLVTRSTVTGDELEDILRPRTDLLRERDVGDHCFEAVEGPVRQYRRTVTVTPLDDGRASVVQTVDFTLALPYFWWLFLPAFKHALGRPGRDKAPWWAPPSVLDARGASVLGSLALVAVVVGYLNTLFTQTIPFAGEEFGAGNSAEGVAGAVVRVGGVMALFVAAMADRRGRRAVLVLSATAGCSLAVTGALAPSLGWLTASQVLARGFATALLLLVAIVAAEEMPAGGRAYAVSLLAMAGGLGAGVCVMSLPLADLGSRGWRLLYVIPALALPAVASVRRRLPESRRFVARHAEVAIAGHGGRLWLLAVAGLLTNVFIAPLSQFGNRFLRSELDFSGGKIGLFSVVTSTPAGLGIVVGGRLADVRGRRRVGAVSLGLGTVLTLLMFFAEGWPVWAWAIVGKIVSEASIPALGVYGPELFPTSLRGRANGIMAVTALTGSAIGLIAAGVLADQFGRIGPAMAILAVAPVIVAFLVLTRFPETAGRELEDLNPEDRPPD